MGVGLQTFSAGSALMFDAEVDLIARKMGTVAITGGTDGSVTVPTTGSGNSIWFFFLPATTSESLIVGPKCSISGNVISWTYSGYGGAISGVAVVGGSLVYGRY